MSWEGSLDKLSAQLEKAKEFRYFALLASFVFFLDFCLIVFRDQPLIGLTYSSAASDIPFGHVLLFFCMLAFFMSFVVPLVRMMITFLGFFIPYKAYEFFSYEDRHARKLEDFFYLEDLMRYAVRRDSAIAYDYYQSLVAEQKKDNLLNYFCLALLLAAGADVYAYSQDGRALVGFLVIFFSDSEVAFWKLLISGALWALIGFCLYFGVIRGCGLTLDLDNRYFFPSHPFRDKS